MSRTLKSAITAAIAIALVGCGAASQERQGSVQMDILADTGSQAALVGDSTLRQAVSEGVLVILKLTYPDGSTEQHNGYGLPLSFKLSPVPVGHYTYTVETTIDTAKFWADGEFDVNKGMMTYVNTIMMQQTNATPAMDVTAPFIKEIKVYGLNDQGSGAWGEFLELKAKVEWPDNDIPDMDNFLALWSSECIGNSHGNSFFVLPIDIKWYLDIGRKGIVVPWADVVTLFKSYCQGTERITLSITNFNSPSCDDPGCEITSTVSFTIPYHEQGFELPIDYNYAPNVFCDSVTNAEPLPGSAVTLNTTIVDRDSNAFKVKWSSDCGGSFGKFGEKYLPTKSLENTFYAPLEYDKECKLTVEVWDNDGGYNRGFVTLKTAPAGLGFSLVPYVDVCDPTTWACVAHPYYDHAQSFVANGELRMSKTAGNGNGIAFGPNARIFGVEGLTLSSVSFDAVGSIGGGSPRVVLNKDLPGQCPLELIDAVNEPGSNNYTFNATETCKGPLERLDIVADMGGKPGEVTITNIKVNGLPVQF